MAGYVINIEQKTLDNNFFREGLLTAQRVQLVVTSLAPGEEMGLEIYCSPARTSAHRLRDVRT